MKDSTRARIKYNILLVLIAIVITLIFLGMYRYRPVGVFYRPVTMPVTVSGSTSTTSDSTSINTEVQKVEESSSISVERTSSANLEKSLDSEEQKYRLTLKNLGFLITNFLISKQYQQELQAIKDVNFPETIKNTIKSLEDYQSTYLNNSIHHREKNLLPQKYSTINNLLGKAMKIEESSSAQQKDYNKIVDQLLGLQEYIYSREFMEQFIVVK